MNKSATETLIFIGYKKNIARGHEIEPGTNDDNGKILPDHGGKWLVDEVSFDSETGSTIVYLNEYFAARARA